LLLAVRPGDYFGPVSGNVGVFFVPGHEPIIARANEAREAMIEVAIEMIKGSHWADFETLTDLIFAGRVGSGQLSRGRERDRH
jgi:hypothetical protein